MKSAGLPLRDRLTNYMLENSISAKMIREEINRKESSIAAYARGNFSGDLNRKPTVRHGQRKAP